jgi:hypothetical protein
VAAAKAEDPHARADECLALMTSLPYSRVARDYEPALLPDVRKPDRVLGSWWKDVERELDHQVQFAEQI